MRRDYLTKISLFHAARVSKNVLFPLMPGGRILERISRAVFIAMVAGSFFQL